MTLRVLFTALFIGFILILFPIFINNSHADDLLRVVGSSSVFPFAATVAEHFSYKTHERMPLIEAVGTGPGIKLFCGNLKGPDGVITSRPFTTKEKERCQERGITFEEFVIGQDGLILIKNKQDLPFNVSLQSLDTALSEKIQKEKECIKNPYKTWHQILATLPNLPIRVLGPAPTSGTYDILIEKLENGCESLLRHDGSYIEAPANENLIVQKVLSTPHTIGIVTFSFYDQNKERLLALPINDVLPTFKSIQEKSYPLSRLLYLYIKTNELNHYPARRAYVLEFTSPDAIGEKGYLHEKGLIPLSSEEQQENYERATHLHEGKKP